MSSRKKLQALRRNCIDTTTKENNQRQKQSRPPPYPNPYNADIIHIEHHALGRLRMNYQRQQTVKSIITSELKKEYEDGKFLRIPVNAERHTLIKGTSLSRSLYIN